MNEEPEPLPTGVRWSFQENGRLLCIASGARFTTEDLFDALDEAIADPRARPPLLLLFDNRGSQENAPFEELDRRVGRFRGTLGTVAPYLAIVVSDMLHFGIGRMSSILGEQHGVTIEVFHDIDTARRWLLGRKL